MSMISVLAMAYRVQELEEVIDKIVNKKSDLLTFLSAKTVTEAQRLVFTTSYVELEGQHDTAKREIRTLTEALGQET